MGRTFNKLVKQVSGRRSGRDRFVNLDERLRNIEVMLLELNAYVSRATFTPDGSGGQPEADVLEAMTDFKKTLERVLGG